MPMTELTKARECFRAAYENRYTWDSQFPGYRADVSFRENDTLHKAQICIKPDFTVEVIGITDEQAQEDLYTQLRDVVTHRKRASFEDAHSKHEFSLGETDTTDAVEILVQGDAMGSNYKIRDREICQVSRVMGRIAFTIDTYESLKTDQGYIASRYDAVFRSPQTDTVIRTLHFEDTYNRVGDYYLMTHQVVRSEEAGQESKMEIDFSNIQLLEPELLNIEQDF